MQQRYATNPAQIPGMTTADLREQYLVPEVFVPGEITVVYTHHDRIVLGGAVPAGRDLVLPGYPEIRSDYFLEHREVGIINVGGTGTVTADGEVYTLVTGACLYLGRGIRDVVFADAAEGAGAGAQFHQPLQAVVTVDHAAIQIVQIRGRETATVQGHQRALFKIQPLMCQCEHRLPAMG